MWKLAGSTDFQSYGHGSNSTYAFRNAQDEAIREHGSGGYTGTVAEKTSFIMATSEVMTRQKAFEYASANYRDYPKDGPAGCVAVGQEKVVAEKEFTIQVQARSKQQARDLATEKMSGGRKRKGAVVEVIVDPFSVEQISSAGKRIFNTQKPNGNIYFKHSASTELFSTKIEAVAHLKEILETASSSWIAPGEVIQITKVQDQGGISYNEAPKLATYTVSGKRIQKVIGSAKGYVFFGRARS